MSEISPWTLTVMPNAVQSNDGEPRLWTSQAPRADILCSVKLAEKNLKAVAAYILKETSGPVTVTDSSITTGSDVVGATFTVGTWLVQQWDYENSKHTFRPATFAERVKYDLR